MREIKCPHCDHVYTSDDMHMSNTDLWAICPNEETVEEKCVSCGKIFWISAGYIPSYIIYKTKDEIL